jgi:hypothetical protein
MRHENINWGRRYVEVGQPVAVYPFEHRGKPFVGIVEKVKKNQFGRVSYVVNGMNVITEELFPSKKQQKLKVPYFKPRSKKLVGQVIRARGNDAVDIK